MGIGSSDGTKERIILMRRVLLAVLVVFAMVAVCLGTGVLADDRGTLMKPWALNVPFGANITTEVNLTDNDLLPTIKGLIPMIGDLAKMGAAQSLGATVAPAAGEMGAAVLASVNDLDTTQLAGAVKDVKAVRILSGSYSRRLSPKDFQMEFEKGLNKMGTFTKVLGNIQDTAVGLYSQGNNGGYVGYTYDPKKGTFMAGRLVGSLDFEKIAAWGMEMAKKSAAAKPAPAPAPQPAPEDKPAEPAPGT
jgi:hypothetical protein